MDYLCHYIEANINLRHKREPAAQALNGAAVKIKHNKQTGSFLIVKSNKNTTSDTGKKFVIVFELDKAEEKNCAMNIVGSTIQIVTTGRWRIDRERIPL